jgi:hypothetical protein
MNDLLWRRQLRDLRTPVTPSRDLWAGIDAALDPLAPPARGGLRQAWLLAASFAGLSLLAIGLSLRPEASPGHAPTTVAATVPALSWTPGDPRLAGAAVELDAARLELRQALEQAPHSLALQRLLLRTQQQQSRLRQLDQQAS